jgi:tetratricopeptide (TPR) repeat protein
MSESAADLPGSPERCAAEVRVATAAFDWPAAEAALDRSLALTGDRPDELLQLAEVQFHQWRFEAVTRTLTRFLAVAADDPRLEQGHKDRVHAARKFNDYAMAEAFAREAVAAFPDSGYFHRVVGEALLMRDQAGEAEPWLVRALELMPQETEARALLQALRAGRASAAAGGSEEAVVKTVPWPTRFTRFADIKELIRRAVLRGYQRHARFITPDTTFLTLGSCFAQNLAVRLRTAGYTAHNEFIGEEVNSTYANRYLLEWIEHGPVDAQTRAMHEAYGEELRQTFRANFAECDAFVFTLGLAPSYFDKATGDFFFMNGRSTITTGYLRQNYEMRTTSVAENQDNIARIIGSVERLSGPRTRIILSVSPVPLGATTEFRSAVIADCISKSTLRVACHEAMKALDSERATYWPSFEMVKWLGTHFGRDYEPAFGLDGGDNRHVSTWLVDAIIDLFLETYAREPRAGDAEGRA